MKDKKIRRLVLLFIARIYSLLSAAQRVSTRVTHHFIIISGKSASAPHFVTSYRRSVPVPERKSDPVKVRDVAESKVTVTSARREYDRLLGAFTSCQTGKRRFPYSNLLPRLKD